MEEKEVKRSYLTGILGAILGGGNRSNSMGFNICIWKHDVITFSINNRRRRILWI